MGHVVETCSAAIELFSSISVFWLNIKFGIYCRMQTEINNDKSRCQSTLSAIHWISFIILTQDPRTASSLDRPVGIGPRFSNFCWYWSGPSSGYFSWFQPGLVPGSEIFLGSSLISGSLIRTEKWPKVLGLCVPEFSQSIASETQQGYNDVRYGCWRRNMFLASLKCW